MAEVVVRPARPDEVEATHDVIAACQAPLFGKPEFTLDHLQSTWDLWTGFTATEGTRVVGTGAVRGDDIVVFVHPDARRRGIGTQLLQAAEVAAPGEVVQSDAVTLESAAAPILRAMSSSRSSGTTPRTSYALKMRSRSTTVTDRILRRSATDRQAG